MFPVNLREREAATGIAAKQLSAASKAGEGIYCTMPENSCNTTQENPRSLHPFVTNPVYSSEPSMKTFE
jgi:hypothetical protein